MVDVVLSSREYIWGGGEVFLFDVGRVLASRGHRVRWRVPPGSRLAARIPDADRISRHRPVRTDLLVANDFRSLWQSLACDPWPRRTFVIHGEWQVSPVRSRIAKAGRVATWAVSTSVRAAAAREGLPDVPVLPLGPATSAEQLAALAAAPAPPSHSPVVGTIGRWHPVKRLELFARTVQAAGWKGRILAPAPTSDAESQLREQVSGYAGVEVVDAPPTDFLTSCDAFLSTSASESLGLAHLEALAAGLPVLSTAQGGPADFLVGALAAGRLPDGAPDALASAAGEALDRIRGSWPAYVDAATNTLRGRGPEACARALLGARW